MGVKCQIFRDNTGDVIRVEAPNGETSILYSDLNNIVNDRNQALDIWSYSYTDEFNEIENTAKRDRNDEHLFTTVINNIENENNSDKSLTKQDVKEIGDSFKNTIHHTLDSLYSALSTAFFTNGIFNVNETKLINSGLYTNAEISNIVSNNKTQETIKTQLDKIDGAFKNNQDVLEVNSALSAKSNSDFIVPTNKFSKLGKTILENPYEVEKVVINSLAGITDINQFNKAVENLPYPELVAKFSNDTAFHKNMFDQLSNKQKVQVFSENQGVIEPAYDNDTFKETLTVIKTGRPEALSVENSTSRLAALPNEVWEDSEEDVKTILNSIEDKTISAGIDIVGLKDKYETKTQDEVVNFLSELSDFMSSLYSGSATTGDVLNFSNVKDNFFNISKIEKEAVVDNTELTLVKLKTNLNEIEVFEQLSMVKAGEDLYHKVAKEENIYDVIYEMVLEDPSILPQTAYYPSAFTSDNIFEPSRVKNKNKAAEIKRDIVDYVKRMSSKYLEVPKGKEAVAEQIMQYKIVFGHPLTVNKQMQSPVEYADFNGDASYLAGEFISDFYIEVVKEKKKNSDLYNNVLKHFSFNGKLEIEDTNPTVIDDIRLLTPTTGIYNKLRQYTKLVKNPILNSLFPTKEIKDINSKVMRRFYLNNPEALRNYSGSFSRVGDDIHVRNVTDNFIRVKDEVFEVVDKVDNISIYRVVEGRFNPDINNMQNDVNVDESVPTGKKFYEANSPEIDFSNTQSLYSKNEATDISERVDNCS